MLQSEDGAESEDDGASLSKEDLYDERSIVELALGTRALAIHQKDFQELNVGVGWSSAPGVYNIRLHDQPGAP